MEVLAATRVQRRTPWDRFDPLLLCALVVLAAIATWMMAPLATGAIAPVTSDTRIEVDVPIATSVTPGWTTGDSEVRLPNASLPGEAYDITTGGWKMSTNWYRGYEVRIRATSSPALRGSNSVDGKGAPASYADFSTMNCPCPWTTEGFDQGVFGYSVSVTSSTGAEVLDADKWGTSQSRKWRGFTRSSYRAYSTAGGSGQYTMAVHLRSMIPPDATQREGSYRAGLIVSAHPLA